MSVNTNAAPVPQLKRLGRERKVSKATQLAQYILLNEIPGLIFGLMTVAYIATSLGSLV